MKTLIKKNCIIIIVIIFVTVLYSTFVEIRPNSVFTSTIFNITGIMFSIGLGLIVTCNLSGIKNQDFIQKIRKNLKKASNLSMVNFAISTLFFLLSNLLERYQDLIFFYNIKLNLNVAFNCMILYSIIYFTANFVAIRKFNDDIFDKINEENEL